MSPDRIKEIMKSVGGMQADAWLGGCMRVWEFMLIADMALTESYCAHTQPRPNDGIASEDAKQSERQP